MSRRVCASPIARLAGLLLPACVTLIAGCGNLTSGGYGDLEVVMASDSVSGEEPQANTQAAPSPLAAAAPGDAFVSADAHAPQRSAESMLLEGTLTLRVQVFALTRPGAAPIELTDGIQEVVMPLSGGSPTLIARRSLPAGTYSGIRTVFLHVEALVEGGLIVDGIAIRGPVRVDLGSRLVIDTPIALTIEEDVPSRVSVNLHTNRWIRLLTQDRRVLAEDFEGEVKVGREP